MIITFFFRKQFGFRKGHFTDHALIKLIDSIYDFNQNKYILVVFIDSSKAFDAVDDNILIDKLNSYGIKSNSLKWFSSYLSNRKQFIQAGAIKTSSFDIICGVPQGSILGPLLLIIYVNEYTFFHKAREKDNISLKLPSLFINDREIKRITSIKYLGVLIDEHLTWKEHIAVIENKVSKNLGLLHRARRVLDSTALKNLYFSFIHSYLNYGK